MTEIRVPTLGESVTEATIGKWVKKPGDPVAVDEALVERETDKVTLEAPGARPGGRAPGVEKRRAGAGRQGRPVGDPDPETVAGGVPPPAAGVLSEIAAK